MKDVQVGKAVVVYTYGGRSVLALVLSARVGEVSHLGANNEPLLTLAFADPARETGLQQVKDKETGAPTGEYIYPIGRVPQIFIEHDVVHESHEFSDEFKQKKGITTDAQIADHRGNGEWSVYVPDGAKSYIDDLRARLAEATGKCFELRKAATDAGAEAETAKARANNADDQVKSLQEDVARRDKVIDQLKTDAIKAKAIDTRITENSQAPTDENQQRQS